ncbi:hypothetical protein GGR57DRAFT_520769, partial [Xylariaceae sp. FL1272]
MPVSMSVMIVMMPMTVSVSISVVLPWVILVTVAFSASISVSVMTSVSTMRSVMVTIPVVVVPLMPIAIVSEPVPSSANILSNVCRMSYCDWLMIGTEAQALNTGSLIAYCNIMATCTALGDIYERDKSVILSPSSWILPIDC